VWKQKHGNTRTSATVRAHGISGTIDSELVETNGFATWSLPRGRLFQPPVVRGQEARSSRAEAVIPEAIEDPVRW
jgi:hypothetical protein